MRAYIEAPEPEDTDVDLHLLSSLEPLSLITRGHHELEAAIEPGSYHLILDSYADESGEYPGPYHLWVEFERLNLGTQEDPILLSAGPLMLPFAYSDHRDTHDARSDQFDRYPPNNVDESGPEFIYSFSVMEEVRFSASIRMPEPGNTDIDLHLLDSLAPLNLLQRNNSTLSLVIPPGSYYLIMDTYAGGGQPRLGPYELMISISEPNPNAEGYFNDYILRAVEHLNEHYSLLGYDSAVLTHDIPYGEFGEISRSGGARTMCVAAVMEVILTAINLYAEESGDETVFDFLPKRSWERLGADDIKAHLWVNHELGSRGTGDALRNFGMGELIPFEELRPGGFVNLNRSNGTGHAVVFLSFIDEEGTEHLTYNEEVIGFRYFSAQGRFDVGEGGLDYRYAIFQEFGSPPMPGRRDINIIRSDDPLYLNTGMMWSPEHWTALRHKKAGGVDEDLSSFDAEYFNGETVDD